MKFNYIFLPLFLIIACKQTERNIKNQDTKAEIKHTKASTEKPAP
ncbi:hypothetical protein BBU29805_K09 (plasmid) [Borreliella burgdorferi 29805]|nr:hypothetical protein BBU29805_K09 [Borreliella burgdorferi 29805]